MHCRSCNVILNDSESSLKYDDSGNIPNPEDRYINLCTRCLKDSDLSHYVVSVYNDEVEQLDEIEIPTDCY